MKDIDGNELAVGDPVEVVLNPVTQTDVGYFESGMPRYFSIKGIGPALSYCCPAVIDQDQYFICPCMVRKIKPLDDQDFDSYDVVVLVDGWKKRGMLETDER